MHSVAGSPASHERVVHQHEPILPPKLEDGPLADDKVAYEVPRAAPHGLEAQRVVLRVGDPVAPHADIGVASIWLQAVVGHVEDVVAVDVYVSLRIRDPIGNAGDAVVGDDVTTRVIQLHALAADTALGGGLIRVVVAHDHVVGDVPVPTLGAQGDRIVEAGERISPDHHVRRLALGPQAVRFIPPLEREPFQPEVAGTYPHGSKHRIPVTGCFVGDVLPWIA